MKPQREISAAGTTFPSSLPGPPSLGFARRLSSVPRRVWRWRYDTKSTAPSVTLQGGTSFLTFPPDQSRRVELRTQPHQREHEGKKKNNKTRAKVAMRPHWTLILNPNSDCVSGKQCALEWDIFDNGVSVNRREEKVHLGPVKEPFVFTTLRRPVSTVWVLSLHLRQRARPSCFPTPAVTFYLEEFRRFVHVRHIVHLNRRHVFDLASQINPIGNPGKESKKSIRGTRERSIFASWDKKKEFVHFSERHWLCRRLAGYY